MNARLSVVRGIAVPSLCEFQDTQTVRLGRSRDNTILIKDERASRLHAKVYAEAGQWYITENQSTNGTLVNGRRIDETTVLIHGSEIGIGSTRLKFLIDGCDASTPTMQAIKVVHEDEMSDEKTTFQVDELTALWQFSTDAVSQTTPNALISLALATIQKQICPFACGFLGLEQKDPLPRITLPAMAKVDFHLSLRLTELARESKRAVWLGAGYEKELDCDSLSDYEDAIGVALRASVPDEEEVCSSEESVFGALHIYRSDRFFTEREVRFCELLAGSLANHLRLLRSHRVLVADNSRMRRARKAGPCEQEMIGESDAINAVRDRIRKFCNAPSGVLILGESGVGKELVAEALHYWSRRSAGPLVCVNCAAIPAQLMESAFFGHRKGAFTGAVANRVGYFEEADDGTLFLDEIGELSLEHQAQLLRVLETKKIRPVGAAADVQVDVRVVAATNRDLKKEVAAGTFRKDLYYRLDKIPIMVPSLRERREDIPLLAQHFLQLFNEECHYHATLTDDAIRKLVTAAWPGNIRQLRSVIETAVSITSGGIIQVSDLDPRITVEEAGPGSAFTKSLNLEEIESATIREALARTNGNVTHAADLLGIHRDTLTNKMKRYQISRLGHD